MRDCQLTRSRRASQQSTTPIPPLRLLHQETISRNTTNFRMPPGSPFRGIYPLATMAQSSLRAEESTSLGTLSATATPDPGDDHRRQATPAPRESVADLNLSQNAQANPYIMSPILPVDVLLMVLEQLRDTPFFPSLRLITKQFNTLVTPILYRHITLTSKILSNFIRSKEIAYSTKSQFQVRHYIGQYTEYISISTTVDSQMAIRLLRSLKNLRQIT